MGGETLGRSRCRQELLHVQAGGCLPTDLSGSKTLLHHSFGQPGSVLQVSRYSLDLLSSGVKNKKVVHTR